VKAINLGCSSGEGGNELRVESEENDLGGEEGCKEDSSELLKQSSTSMVVVGGRRVNGRRQMSLLFGKVQVRR
jgi:hypothetical protein